MSGSPHSAKLKCLKWEACIVLGQCRCHECFWNPPQDLKKYRSIMSLQSHVEERKGGEAETRVNTKVIKLLELYNIHTEGFMDVVHQICGIFDTNSFDLPADNGKVDLAGLFPNAAMLMHSCIKNTRMTIT